MQTYRLRNQERSALGGGFTHVSKVTYTDIAANTVVPLYYMAPGDICLVPCFIVCKKAVAGGSALVALVGELDDDGTTFTETLVTSATLTGATANKVFPGRDEDKAVAAYTATVPFEYAVTSSVTNAVALKFTTVTGTYTAGEFYVYFTVINAGALADRQTF